MMEEESNKENNQMIVNDGINSSFEIVEEEEGSSPDPDGSDTPLEDEDPLSDEVTSSSSQQQHQEMMEIETMTSNGSQGHQQQQQQPQPLLSSNISEEVQVKADSSSNCMEYEDVEIPDSRALDEASCSSLSSSSSDQSNNDSGTNTNNASLEQHQDTDFSMFVGNPAFKYPKIFTDYGGGERRERKTYKCWYCPTVDFLLSNYLVHKQRHLTQSQFKCSTCSFSCSSSTVLQIHNICHKNVNKATTATETATTSQRSLANNSTAVKRKLMTSSTSTEPKRQLVTPLDNQIDADSTTTTSAPIKIKRKYRPRGTLLKCEDPNCPAVFDKRDNFLIHLKRHSDSSAGKKACHLCTYKVKSASWLKKHILQHNANKSMEASNAHGVPKNKGNKKLAEKQFVALDNQIINENTDSNVESTGTGVTTTKKVYKPRGIDYKCIDPKCPGALFDRPSVFKKHLTMHSNSNVGWNYACHLCTYKANYSHTMRIHNLRHADKSELSYDHDERKNKIQRSTYKNLKSKIPKIRIRVVRKQIMPERKNYKCAQCPGSFARVKELELHTKRHFDVSGRNKCRFCTYAVFAPKLLRRHELLHRKNEPQPTTSASSNKQGNIEPEPSQSSASAGLSNSVSPTKSPRLVQAFGGSRCGPYRPKWLIARKKPRVKLNVRRRGDPVKDGYLTQEELDEIKLGNPEFEYNDTYTYSNGRVVAATFRCLMCPKSLRSYKGWLQHQNSTHSSSNKKSRWQPTNTMRSSQDGQFFPITKTEPNTPSPNIVKNNCSSLESPKTHTPTNSSNSSSQKPSTSSGRAYNLQINPKREIELPEADETDYLFEDSNKSGQMIVGLKMNNFMMIAEKEIKSLNKTLCELRDERNSGGKTTTIVALLFGLGYDLLLGSSENSTLCGVDISNVLRHGTTSGYVEVTLNLKSSQELVKSFGEQLILHRGFTAGTSVSNSKLVIRHGKDETEEISKSQLVYLMNNLIPTFLLRLMVLNTENIEYLAQNFHVCDEIFMTLLEAKKTKLLVKAREMRSLIDSYKEDLDSRKERISYLKSSVLKNYAGIPKLHKLQVEHSAELKTALEINDDVLNVHNNLIRTESILIARISDQLVELIDRMRNPFRKFLHTQNYVGDILINNDGQGLVVWMKETNFSTLQTAHTTLDEAKQIWKSLTIGRRKLAIIGLYVAFWQIMDCCPVMVSDSYSNSDLEFKFPKAAFPVLLAFIKGHEKSSRQFFLSLPNTQ